MLQQIRNMTTSYDSLVQTTAKINSGEGSSNTQVRAIHFLKGTVAYKLEPYIWTSLSLIGEIQLIGS